MNLGQRIRELRYARHVSYKATKASRGHLSRIECGHQAPSLEMLERLSAEFEMGLEVLLGSDERFYSTLMLEDEFVGEVRKCLKSLNEEQRIMILNTLAAAPCQPSHGKVGRPRRH